MAAGFKNTVAHGNQIKALKSFSVGTGKKVDSASAQKVAKVVAQGPVKVQAQSKRFTGGRNPL